MSTWLIFEVQYFNFDWKITAIAVTETLNSDKYMTSLPLWIKRRWAKSGNLPTQKKLFCVYQIHVILNFTELLKNILKFTNFTEF